MSALALTSVTGAAVNDGTRQITPVGVLGADGALFQPAMATVATPGFLKLTDGSTALPFVDTDNLPVGLQAVAAGGATPYKYIAAASANQDSQNIKASAGTLYGVTLTAIAASLRYLKIYDKATAPTSADTPKHTYAIPASAGLSFSPPMPACGEAYADGIGIRITTGLADNDANAATANDCVVNLTYQ